MDTERDVANYEFTLSPIGAMLSFDPPPEAPGAPSRPRGFPAQPKAEWIRPAPGQPGALLLTYPNLPRPARLLFQSPPLPMILHFESQLPFIACQTRAGEAAKAHFCSFDEASLEPPRPQRDRLGERSIENAPQAAEARL